MDFNPDSGHLVLGLIIIAFFLKDAITSGWLAKSMPPAAYELLLDGIRTIVTSEELKAFVAASKTKVDDRIIADLTIVADEQPK